MKEVATIQGTPDSFADTQFNYGSSRVYFWNGRVTSWQSYYPNTLKGKLAATPTNKAHFTVGSAKGEVIAIQGQPDSFTDTQFNYGSSRVYFWNGRVTSWQSYYPNTLKGKLASTYTNKTYFSVGSTRGEVVAIQGQPDSFTDTQFNYSSSRVYFWNGRVTSWQSYYPNTLKGKLASTYTNKTYFSVGSTRGEVVAIQGQPDSFTDTQFNYGSSRVYFWDDRVTSWRSYYPNTLKGKLAATYTNKTYFSVGSTRGEVVAIQGQPDSFTDTQFNYGSSRVYFWDDRVTSWRSYYPNTLKGKLAATYTNKTYFSVGSTRGEVVAIQGQPDSFTDTQFNYGSSRVYFWDDRVTSWRSYYPNTLKVR